MRWILPILAVFLFACKNERGDYPSTIIGTWTSLESEETWIKFDSTEAVVNILYDNVTLHDTTAYVYIHASGLGSIPILYEENNVGIVEIRMSEDDDQMVIVGEDKDVRGLFTYHMISKD